MTDEKNKENESTNTQQAMVDNNIEEKPENNSLFSNLLSTKQWFRFAFMLLFTIVLSVVSHVIGLLVILQFIFVLVAGKDNEKLRLLGSSFSTFIFQILQFLTYNSEEKPFPFSDWPDSANPQNDEDSPAK